MCLAISNDLLLVLQDTPKRIFFLLRTRDLLVSQKNTRKDTFFPTFHPLSTVIFATAAVLAFVLLRNSRFIFHCYTQREATPTQKSARKCAATSRDFLRERLQAHSLYQTSFAESPNRTSTYHVGTGVGRFRAFTRGPAASIVLAALEEVGTVPVAVAVLSAHPPQAGPGEFRFGAHAFLCHAQN